MGQQRGGHPPLQRQRVNLVADRAQTLPPRAQARQLAQAGQRPGVARLQVLGLLQGQRPEGEPHGGRVQHGQVRGGVSAGQAARPPGCPAAPIAVVNAWVSIAPAYRDRYAPHGRLAVIPPGLLLFLLLLLPGRRCPVFGRLVFGGVRRQLTLRGVAVASGLAGAGQLVLGVQRAVTADQGGDQGPGRCAGGRSRRG